MIVKPDYTRRKIGGKLLEEAERLIARSGVTELILYVHHENKVGVSFYRKKGFICKGNNDDHLIMARKYET